MSELNLEAREVLKHLNDLGYRNITVEQLKDFMKDLKKLIKYDKNPEINKQNIKNEIGKSHKYEYMKPTECSKAKRNYTIDSGDGMHKIECCGKSLKTSSTIDLTKNDKVLNEIPINHGLRNRNRLENEKMWIRTKDGNRHIGYKKSDPVSLYQAYQSDWNRFKEQIPIDNKHLDLRWNVRQKTIG